MKRIAYNASPISTINRFAALANANGEDAEMQDAPLAAEADDADPFDESQTSASSPGLAPIPLSLPGLAASQYASTTSQGRATDSPTAAIFAFPIMD